MQAGWNGRVSAAPRRSGPPGMGGGGSFIKGKEGLLEAGSQGGRRSVFESLMLTLCGPLGNA